MRGFVFCLVLVSVCVASAAQVITQSVAEVNAENITSRQVILTALLSLCLKNQCGPGSEVATDLKSDGFTDLVSKAIFERLAFYESKDIFKKPDTISPRALKAILAHPLRQTYVFEKREIIRSFQLKSLAQKYIQFKDKNLSVYVTTADAQKYYEANTTKFGGLGFKQFEQKIKVFLQAEIKKERVENWVLNMQKKYKVKQFLN